MAHIKTPFTVEQVEKLKEWQSNGMNHPFTCCGYDGCIRKEQKNEGELIPYSEGWICPCGRYTQDWCHDFMLNTNPKHLLTNDYKLDIDQIDRAINGDND